MGGDWWRTLWGFFTLPQLFTQQSARSQIFPKKSSTASRFSEWLLQNSKLEKKIPDNQPIGARIGRLQQGRRTTHCWIYVDRICWKKEEKRHRWNLPCTSIGIRTVTLQSPRVKPGPFQQLPLRSGLRAQQLSVDREGGYIQVQGSDT